MNSTLARSFQQKSYWEMDVMPNVNFALSHSNNKNQLRDLIIYSNQKLITRINTYDSSTLEKDLITSHQVILCPHCSFQLKLLKITISITGKISQNPWIGKIWVFLSIIMSWEKIFSYIGKSMETSFPYLGIVWEFLNSINFYSKRIVWENISFPHNIPIV